MEESNDNKLLRKMKDDPVVPIGVLGMCLTLAYGAYKYKSARKVMSTSVFLMQLRVAAQGTVIGCMGIGMVYNLVKNMKNYGKPATPSTE
ncbi:HIG1 domain family member 1A, mitochondrial-like [Lycorma delicatula]|uniref:HIG1 domain family member 1A, mitochondrial-like n=1 Tax=Lycorma delicatula TaxID=130591 RepID=UPI003F519C25